MDDLANKKCIPCEGGIPAFDIKEIHKYLKKIDGWDECTKGIKEFDKLPVNARAYISRIQTLIGIPIDIISTGPDRDDTVILNHPFS